MPFSHWNQEQTNLAKLSVVVTNSINLFKLWYCLKIWNWKHRQCCEFVVTWITRVTWHKLEKDRGNFIALVPVEVGFLWWMVTALWIFRWKSLSSLETNAQHWWRWREAIQMSTSFSISSVEGKFIIVMDPESRNIIQYLKHFVLNTTLNWHDLLSIGFNGSTPQGWILFQLTTCICVIYPSLGFDG